MSIDIIKKRECTGCYGCYNSCGRRCITMVSDREGFVYPHIDKKRCNGCNLCEKMCPLLSPKAGENDFDIPEVFAAWTKDMDIRVNSTSGGVFSEIALDLLRRGGYVYGAVYGEDFEIKHCIIHTPDELYQVRQSKYAQSNIGMIYNEIKVLLRHGEMVLFCGTPCQCEALYNLAGGKKENLILVDFICRGVNSPVVFRKFLEFLENTYHKKVQRVWFKNKEYGWNRFSTKVEFTDGSAYLQDRYHDWFMKGYIGHNLYMRPSCEKCLFKKIPQISDITLADFWGIKLKDSSLDIEKGTSLVMVNSEAGKHILSSIGDKLYMEEKDIQDVYQGNPYLLRSPKYIRKCRNYFFDHLDKQPFDELIERSIRASRFTNIKRIVKKQLRQMKQLLKASESKE